MRLIVLIGFVFNSSCSPQEKADFTEQSFEDISSIDSLSDSDILELLYKGEFINGRYVIDSSGIDRTSFKASADGNVYVELGDVVYYDFDSLNLAAAIVLNHRYDREFNAEDCHVCAPYTEVSIFKKDADHWQLEAGNLNGRTHGSWGEPSEINLFHFGKSLPVLEYKLFYGNQGHFLGMANYFSLVPADKAREVFAYDYYSSDEDWSSGRGVITEVNTEMIIGKEQPYPHLTLTSTIEDSDQINTSIWHYEKKVGRYIKKTSL